MSVSADERKVARREAMAGLSLLFFLAAALSLGGIFLFRAVPDWLGYDMDRPLSGWALLGVGVAVILAIVLLVCIAGIGWLLFARLFFTRTEVWKVFSYGPTSRLDRWLVNRLVPERPDETQG